MLCIFSWAYLPLAFFWKENLLFIDNMIVHVEMQSTEIQNKIYR